MTSRQDRGSDFARRTPTDNPEPDKVEAQRDRDRAAKLKEQADAAAGASQDGNRDLVEAEGKLGRGPAGLNQGPSDTHSVDPHNPRDNSLIMRPGADPRTSDGMGASPPRSAQPTSDKPEYARPAVDRAKALPEGHDPQAREHADQVEREDRQVKEAQQRARGDLDKSERHIANQQSAGSALSNEEKAAHEKRRQDRD